MKKNYFKVWLIIALTGIVYIPTFVWMWGRWFAKDSYYSHGILIPIVSLFLVWSKREELKRISTQPAGWGLWLIIGALIIHLGSAWMRVYFVSGISLIILIMGLILYFLGHGYLKSLLFSILFLIFMVPMPLVVIANLSLKMKLFATQVSTIILKRIGIPAIRDGSTIRMLHSFLEVGDPCSGLRSLISLLALGALFAYFFDRQNAKFRQNAKRVIFFLSAVPIAILANIFRIVLLASVTEIYGTKVAMGFFHDFSGFLLFGVALLSLLIVRKVLE